jgi:hypothetical protein
MMQRDMFERGYTIATEGKPDRHASGRECNGLHSTTLHLRTSSASRSGSDGRSSSLWMSLCGLKSMKSP